MLSRPVELEVHPQSTTTARAYTFFPKKGADGRRDFGWAICTVNDKTGELLITSDWGNFAHRWPPEHLGRPSLHHFLCGTDYDYIARKLLRGDGGCRLFSPRATTRAILKALCERRLEDGRRLFPRTGSRRQRLILGATSARSLWEQMNDLTEEISPAIGEVAATLYFERLPPELYEYLDEVHYYAQDEPSFEYQILTETILPALRAACRATVETDSCPFSRSG